MNASIARAQLAAILFAAGCAGVAANDLDYDTTSTRTVASLAPAMVAGINAVPADTELKRRGTRIGIIFIDIGQVFDERSQLAAPYRIVNRLHVATHEATVRQQLLFQHGDRFDRHALEETERVLREQRYLNDASISTVRYNDDNTVDVMVRVHDVWTMSPGISVGRKGGENSAKLKFEDSNFLGLGKQVTVARSKDVDRSAWTVGYLDPHVLGSWWRLALRHAQLSDGADDGIEIGRPFHSLDSRWSSLLEVSDTSTVQAWYALAQPYESFSMHEQIVALGGGISSGLQAGWTRRLLFGARYDDRRFAPARLQEDVVLPDDRRFVYPYVGLQWIEDAFVQTRNLDQIGRTEDVHLGRSLTMTAGLASTLAGSTSDALLLDGSAAAGMQFGDDRFLTGSLALRTRVEGAALRNTQLDVQGRYYLRHSKHRVSFVSADVALTSALDDETQLLLGGDNGLRGYPLRYQAGTSRALITLEERFYTDWQPLKLANVGAAIFVDAGRMWGRDDHAPAPRGWLADVGLGLRLGSARSGLGNVLHVDLAFPLQGGVDSMQLTIETKKSF